MLQFARHEGFSTIEVMCWPVGKAERKYAGVTHIDVIGLTKTKAHDILGKTLEDRMKAVKVARDVLAPFFG